MVRFPLVQLARYGNKALVGQFVAVENGRLVDKSERINYERSAYKGRA